MTVFHREFLTVKEKIHFYYTNDFHSYFDHWSRVATFMKMKRITSAEKGESSWLIDIGDHVDRVHPITEATMGKANVNVLNELAYDFVTIGNNEGLTLAHKDLYHLYDDANFDVICSNLQCTISENPTWLHRSKIVTSKHGVKIGLLGLTAPFNPYYHLLGWHIEEVSEVLEKEIARLHDKVDVMVLLSHLGIHEDQRIATLFPQIDCIIGGHTHHLYRTGEIIGNTLLTAAGKQCAFVGEVTLTWDHQAGHLVGQEAYATEITHFHRDLRTEQQITELSEMASVILNKKIIFVDKVIKNNWFKETKIMKQLTEKMRQWTNADCAMLNAGLLLDEFPAGEITYAEVHRICPHPINPCVVSLTGAELLEVVRASLSKPFMEMKLKGFGFRGEVIGRMIFAGLEVKTDFTKDGIEHVTSVTWNGKAIERERNYRVATADTFTFGRLLPEVAKSEVKELFLPEFLREILVQTLLEFSAE